MIDGRSLNGPGIKGTAKWVDVDMLPINFLNILSYSLPKVLLGCTF